jgi:hypothetical protein
MNKRNKTQGQEEEIVKYIDTQLGEAKPLIEEYNDSILNVPQEYAEILPMNYNILVRCYKSIDRVMGVREEEQAGGKRFVPFKNPFPYNGKAVVVRTCENNLDYKVGDIIYLQERALGLTGSAYDMKMHYSFSLSKDNRDEGFLLLPMTEIKCKLKQ